MLTSRDDVKHNLFIVSESKFMKTLIMKELFKCPLWTPCMNGIKIYLYLESRQVKTIFYIN